MIIQERNMKVKSLLLEKVVPGIDQVKTVVVVASLLPFKNSKTSSLEYGIILLSVPYSFYHKNYIELKIEQKLYCWDPHGFSNT